MNTKTLAERCYESERAGDELFKEIHRILGGPDLIHCSEPGFAWKCADSWVDGYDASVEVVLCDGIRLNRQQADEILALGFGQIYESPAGVCWTKTSNHACSPRDVHEESSLRVAALKAKIRELSNQ